MQDQVSGYEERLSQMRAMLAGCMPDHDLPDAADFLTQLLHMKPWLRMSPEEALNHPFLRRA